MPAPQRDSTFRNVLVQVDDADGLERLSPDFVTGLGQATQMVDHSIRVEQGFPLSARIFNPNASSAGG
jgi:hypothetical protein